MTKQEIVQKYLDLGLTVLTIAPGQKSPVTARIAPPGIFHKEADKKHEEYQRDTINPAQIAAITDAENIALSMGLQIYNYSEAVRFIHALDFDSYAAYRDWDDKNPGLTTPTQITKKGFHVFFTLPYVCRNGVSEKISVISQGWYTLVYPSIHPDGPHYVWDVSPFDTPFIHLNDLREMKGIDFDKLDWEPDDYPGYPSDEEDEEEFYFDPI